MLASAAGTTTTRPANTTRFVYLDPAARDFFLDYDRMAQDAAAISASKPAATPTTPTSSPSSANCPPRANCSVATGGPTASSSTAAAANDSATRCRRTRPQLRSHGTGLDTDLRINTYTADPGTSAADGLTLLSTWAATTLADIADRPTR